MCLFNLWSLKRDIISWHRRTLQTVNILSSTYYVTPFIKMPYENPLLVQFVTILDFWDMNAMNTSSVTYWISEHVDLPWCQHNSKTIQFTGKTQKVTIKSYCFWMGPSIIKFADFIMITKVSDRVSTSRLPLHHTGLNLTLSCISWDFIFSRKTVLVCSNKSKQKFINHSLGKLTNVYWKE